MTVPVRKPALTKAPVRTHPLAPAEVTARAAADPLLAAILEHKPATQLMVEDDPLVAEPTAPAASSRGMGTMSFRVDLDLRHAVKRYAVEHETTVQAVMADALRKYLAEAE
jgi:hypothetical protein